MKRPILVFLGLVGALARLRPEGFQAIGRRLYEHIPMPGAHFKQLVAEWLQRNGFVTDSLRLGGRPARSANIRIPVPALVATREDITTERATSPIVEALTGTETTLMASTPGTHAFSAAARR
jgi:polyhydroxyalkanoate synthase